MKKLYPFILSLSLVAGFVTRADVPVFGNTTNGVGSFAVGDLGNQLIQSGTFGFMPQENLAVSSVTLWLTGYTPSTEQYFDNLSVGIYGNMSGLEEGIANEPDVSMQLGSLDSPGPNDGSTAAFTFTDASGPIQLEAGQEYWIWLNFDFVSFSSGTTAVQWDGGGTPEGDAAYDGFEQVFFGLSPDDTFTPAFAINTVPEPSVMAFMGLTLLFGIGRLLCHKSGST